MAKNKKAHDDAWARAKRLCRLSSRHVEMAKKLGMNPRKLPRLNPLPSQRWKTPVRVFIEDLYEERFGTGEARPRHNEAGAEPEPSSIDATSVIEHLANLTDALERATARDRLTSGDLLEVAADLRRVAEEIESGRSVYGLPYAQLDVRRLDAEELRRVDRGSAEEIPF